jgi:non-specific serine/threonine protein kinase
MRLERDHDNLRASIRWAMENGAIERGLRIAGDLWYFWWLRGHPSEGRMWLERLLAMDTPDKVGPVPSLVRARALNGAAWLAYAQGNYDAAASLAREADALSDDGPDGKRVRAFALNTRAMVAMDRVEYVQAATLQQAALSLRRELNDHTGIGVCLNNLGLVASQQHDYARAMTLLEESASLFRSHGDLRNTALALVNLGRAHFDADDLDRAESDWTESLRLAAQLGGALLEESTFQGIEGLGEVAAARGRMLDAARLLAAATASRNSASVPRPARLQPAFDEAIRLAHAALGDKSFAAAELEGAALSTEKAVAAALGSVESAAT